MAAAKPYDGILTMLGKSRSAWDKLISFIETNYDMDEIWVEGKPESNYRNELKYRRGGKTLITLYIRNGFFKAVIIFGKAEREKFEKGIAEFSEPIRQLYEATDAYHDGKWLGIDVRDETLIDEIFLLLQMKRKPNRKSIDAKQGN